MNRYGISFILVVFVSSICAAWPKKMLITGDVVNLRHQPRSAKVLTYKKLDWEQTSQLLYGERVLAFEKRRGWLRIKALDQRIFANKEWHGCSGWIKANQAVEVSDFPHYNLIVKKPWVAIYGKNGQLLKTVSFGTHLLGRWYKNHYKIHLLDGKVGIVPHNALLESDRINRDTCRSELLKGAKQFLGTPYLWGGRSFYDPGRKGQLTSVDCSSFVELCYKVYCGKDIPRNSKSQYIESKKIKRNPKPGDLLFISTHGTVDSIKHVMFYCGNDRLLHAKGNFLGKQIRKVIMMSGKECLGKPVGALSSGDKVREGFVLFGSYLG